MTGRFLGRNNMDEAKELIYHGTQPEEDVMPKVKFEDIPEDRRKSGAVTWPPSMALSAMTKSSKSGWRYGCITFIAMATMRRT